MPQRSPPPPTPNRPSLQNRPCVQNHPSATLRQAAALLGKGRARAALALLRPVVAGEPEQAEALSLYGIALAHSGKSREAVAALTKAVTLRPDRSGFRLNLARVHQDRGDLAAARAVLMAGLDHTPGEADLHEGLGLLHLTDREPARAAEAFTAALASAPNRATALKGLGDARLRLEEFPSARTAYEAALTAAPDFTAARVNLGAVLEALGDIQAAAKTYETALSQKPDHHKARINLGTLRLNQGQAEAALTCFDTVLAAEPHNGWALAYRDLARVEAGHLTPEAQFAAQSPFITAETLAVPKGWDSLAAFNSDLAQALLVHPNRRRDVSGTATTHGDDALDLFASPARPLKAFERVLRRTLDKRLATLRATPGEPFPGPVPERYRLDIWATYLRSGGYQAPHIHPTGWLSGVYYVQLPDDLDTAREDGAPGAIEFNRPDPDLHLTFTPAVRLVRPTVGLLLTFPSTLYHRTLPFSGPRLRLSIAFDVRPLA